MNGENPVVANQVRGPAIGLVASAVIGILTVFASVGFRLIAPAQSNADAMAQLPEFFRFVSSTGYLVASSVFGLICSGFVLFAGLRMMKLQSYTLAVVGAVVTMVPCLSPCCCIGLPLGIWALIVLLKPEVKAAFH